MRTEILAQWGRHIIELIWRLVRRADVNQMRKRIAVLLLLILPGCSSAPAPEAEFTLSSVRPAAARIDAELTSITVEPASRDRVVYPLPSTLTPLLPLWRTALQDALARYGIFRPGAPRRLTLVVKVLEFSLSGRILSVLARYQLFDNPPGAPAFSTDIMTNQGFSALATSVTSLEDPAVATQHRTEVIRAIQDNITQFLDQIEAFARQQRGGAVARPAVPNPL
jgi:hypothetical protein